MTTVSRRSFLMLLGAAAASKAIVPAFAMGREPYVFVGEQVSYIGLAKYPAPVFVGTSGVREILPWDGVGFPCRLADQAAGYRDGLMTDVFYDTDLADFRRELPENFWHDEARKARYPNVHAYVREQRYGEDPIIMWRRLGYDAPNAALAA
jgi:hypothetical protein